MASHLLDLPEMDLPEPSPQREEGGGSRRVVATFFSGTSSEYLGRRPMPRALLIRPVVFLLGPSGVGKTRVASRLLGAEAQHITGKPLLDVLSYQARYRRWPDPLRFAPALIMDGPCFLTRRPAVQQALRGLIQARVADGLRTALCEADDVTSLLSLMEGVSPDLRATIALRFPEGRGRRRTAARMCDELGMSRVHARKVVELEPWTYTRVLAALVRIREEQGG